MHFGIAFYKALSPQKYLTRQREKSHLLLHQMPESRPLRNAQFIKKECKQPLQMRVVGQKIKALKRPHLKFITYRRQISSSLKLCSVPLPPLSPCACDDTSGAAEVALAHQLTINGADGMTRRQHCKRFLCPQMIANHCAF